MSDRFDRPAVPRTTAIVGLVLSVSVAAVGLFALPTLQSAFGLGFQTAFWSIVAVEFLAAVGAGWSVLRLFDRGPEV